MTANSQQHRVLLQSIAHRAMLECGLLPEFSAEALAQLGKIQAPAVATNGESIRDLTNLLWASIDNDDSRDLDQLTVAEALPGDKIKILVAIADVDSLITSRSAINEHTCHNTTSVYTAAMIFPMLPEKLSTDLTSLNVDEDRLASLENALASAVIAARQGDYESARLAASNFFTSLRAETDRGLIQLLQSAAIAHAPCV